MNWKKAHVVSAATFVHAAVAIADPAVLYEKVARTGEQAADLPVGVVYGSFENSAVINNAGHIAFVALLAGPGITTANDRALFFWDGIASHLVAQEGDAASNVPGLNIAELTSTPTLNSSDEISTLCVTSDGLQSALFADSTQSPTLATWSGGPLTWWSSIAQRMNDSADMLLIGRLGCFCLCDYELGQGPAGGLSLLNGACSLAPDLGVEMGEFTTIALAQSGNSAYAAKLNTAHDRNAGFVPDGLGAMTNIGRDGDAAPDLAGSTLRFAGAQFNLNSSDQYSVVLGVNDTTTRAVYQGQHGSMSLLAVEGGARPDGGVWSEPSQAQINEAGQIVFGAAGASGFYDGTTLSTVSLDGANSVFINEEGFSVYCGPGPSGMVEVWLRDIDGALAPIGDVSAGPLPMVDGSTLDPDAVEMVGEATQGRHAGGPQSLNDNSQVAVRFQMPGAGDYAIVRATARCKISDLDENRTVDGADLADLLSQWGGPGSADFNNDGTVDGADLALLLAEWGAC